MGYDHENNTEVGFPFCGNEDCKPNRDEEGYMTWEGHRLIYWE